MTRMLSAQRTSFSLTVRFAFGLVPAERTDSCGSEANTRSAVGLRHWFRLQMKRMFGKLTAVLFGFCGHSLPVFAVVHWDQEEPLVQAHMGNVLQPLVASHEEYLDYAAHTSSFMLIVMAINSVCQPILPGVPTRIRWI